MATAASLQAAGWQVGKDRVQRIWRREGLKVPQKHRPRSRLWLNDGSCVRLRPLHRNHVWSFDFVQAQTHDGRSLRILIPIDEYNQFAGRRRGLLAVSRLTKVAAGCTSACNFGSDSISVQAS